MKVLVTGACGQLGYDVCKELNLRKIKCIETDINDFEITDENKTLEYIKKFSPDVVVHCAAYTAVDNAEDEKDVCNLVNAKGTEYIAKACKSVGAKILYISTDYVFNGEGNTPNETSQKTAPLNVYGLSKLNGEMAVKKFCDKYFIVRTSWVFGLNGNNFVKTIIRLANERDEISVVNDQIGSPTYTKDLAHLICDMINTDRYGVYHATNEGFCSFADFAKKIVKLCGCNTKVNCISTEEFNAKAVRPKNSRLSKQSLIDAGFDTLPNWEDALNRFYKEINNQ